MSRLWPAALPLLFATALCGAEERPAPKPPGKEEEPVSWKSEGVELPPPASVKYQAGRLIRVKATVRAGAKVGWQVLVTPAAALDWVPSDADVSMPFPAAGTTVFVIASVNGDKDAAPSLAVTTVTVEAAPAPRPPAPEPKPAAGAKLHVTVVLDYAAVTPAQAALANSATLRKALADDNAVFRTYPVTSEVLKARKLDAVVTRAGGVPALVVQDDSGKVLSAVTLPATEAELLALVARLRKGG